MREGEIRIVEATVGAAGARSSWTKERGEEHEDRLPAASTAWAESTVAVLAATGTASAKAPPASAAPLIARAPAQPATV